jgi:hypothetical protein
MAGLHNVQRLCGKTEQQSAEAGEGDLKIIKANIDPANGGKASEGENPQPVILSVVEGCGSLLRGNHPASLLADLRWLVPMGAITRSQPRR